MNPKTTLWVAKGYYYAPNGAVCTKCRTPVENLGWQILVYFKKSRGRDAEEHVRCYGCYDRDERFFGDAESVLYFVPEKPPSGVHAVPVIPSPPDLVGVRGVGMDVFEAADKLQDVQVVDNTVWSGRPEALVGTPGEVLIGKRPEDVRDPDRDEALLMLPSGGVDAVSAYLRDLVPVSGDEFLAEDNDDGVPRRLGGDD
jgi:hypothetical protein